MPPPEYRRCDYCAQTYSAQAANQRFCSREHKERHRKYGPRRATNRTCQECRAPFVRPHGYGRTKFCSDTCAAVSLARYRCRGTLDLVAREISEKVGLRATADYLGSMRHDPCAFCGQCVVDLDHIEPRHAGGSNAWHNRSALCAACNGRKARQTLLTALLRRQIIGELTEVGGPLLDELAVLMGGTSTMRWGRGEIAG